MNNNKKIELLSPVGNYESAISAIKAGADSIYVGGPEFGLRAYAESVTENRLEDIIKYVKDNGKKIFITLNSLIKNNECDKLIKYVDELINLYVDGLIIGDLGVYNIVRNKYDIYIKASTQLNACSSKSVKFLDKIGFNEIILARELSLKEIKEINKEVKDIKLECFIHGSMCYSYSGACLYSSMIGGESGNRGRCKGPCRLEYNFTNLGQNKNDKYMLSMKDMCGLKYLKNLIDIGISSLKIEGRMRKPNYVYEVTKKYREYIDMIYNEEDILFDKIINDEKELLKVYNKGGFTNYFESNSNMIVKNK